MTEPAPSPSASSRPQLPRWTPSGFFALRTPLLAFEEFLALGADLRGAATPSEDKERLAEALAADAARQRERLTEILGRPEVLEALFIASPSLEESLGIWRESPDSERGQKVERGLLRYVSRMAARPTPFGLFAGCSVGRGAASTRLAQAPKDTSRRHSRLDMDC